MTQPRPAARTADGVADGVVSPAGADHGAATWRPVAELPVEVRRSARRTRTVSADRVGDTVVVRLPARLSAEQEARWVRTMVDRLAGREARAGHTDEALARRAAGLRHRYLSAVPAPRAVRWADNQQQRWGSCTPDTGTIRLSTRLRGMPDYVLDYVLVHELAHLAYQGHGPEFWALVACYPEAERARGYLEGYSAAARARA